MTNTKTIQSKAAEGEKASARKLYKSYLRSCTYITQKGKQIIFSLGRYSTSDADEIAELDKLVADGNPHIYVDANEPEDITVVPLSIEDIKRRAVEEYLASVAVATDKNSDKGTSTQGKLVPTSTSDVASVSAGSSSK